MGSAPSSPAPKRVRVQEFHLVNAGAPPAAQDHKVFHSPVKNSNEKKGDRQGNQHKDREVTQRKDPHRQAKHNVNDQASAASSGAGRQGGGGGGGGRSRDNRV